MAIALSCPGCESTLNVSETLVGKSIKCKTCGEMVAVTAPVKAAKAVAKKAAVAVVDDDDDRPRSKSPRRRGDEDDDDDDRPMKKSKATAGGSKVPLILGLAAAGVLLLGGAAGGAYWIFGTKKEDDVVKNTTPTPAVTPTPTPTPTPEAKPPEEKKEPVKTEEPKKTDEAKPVEPTKAEAKADAKPETKTEVKPADSKLVARAEEPAKGDDRPGQSSSDKRRLYLSGELDDLTLKQCRSGTVFVKCETPFGSGVGSGWFGIEENIVITNAHVISMIAPNSPPPTKLELVLNSGEFGQNPGIKERVIPHQRIKILAVDRRNDIAILQIIGEKDLPPPFKIKPTAELRDNQGISILGFPLGYDIGQVSGNRKNPTVSNRKSTVAALRYDDYGILRKLQVQGGISPGNSGGPQFDGDGKVCAMTVAIMVEDKTIGLAVPTEQIMGLMAGRIDEVEIDTAFNKDGMVHVPIRVTTQDPMKRLKSIGVGTWLGETSNLIRPPGEMRRGMLSSDKDYKEVALKYESGSKEAIGTLVLPPLTPGLSYFVQPFFQNALVPKFYLPGMKVEMKGPPCDLVPSSLIVNLKPGPTRPFTLWRSTSQDEYAEGEGRDKDRRLKILTEMKGTEQVMARAGGDTLSAARLRLKYNDAELKVDRAGDIIPFFPTRMAKQLKDNIGQIESYALVNQRGGIYKTTTNLLAARDPLVRAFGTAISTNALGTLQECSIPLPNKDVQPNETWPENRTVALTLSFLDHVRNGLGGGGGGRPNQPPGGRPRPGEGDDDAPGGTTTQVVAKREYLYTSEMKFTYQGVRTRAGKKEAVIRVTGKITPAAGQPKDSASGTTKGYAFIDIATGIVLDADIESEFELDTSIQGLKTRSYSVNHYKLTRDGSVK